MREKTNDIIFSIIDLFPLLVRLQLLKDLFSEIRSNYPLTSSQGKSLKSFENIVLRS